ncbi:MAG: hypothetical protein ACM4AI_09930, partial [Acidobacteriota bacterium]
MQSPPRFLAVFTVATILFLVIPPAAAQSAAKGNDQQSSAGAQSPANPGSQQQPPAAVVVPCTSKVGERQECPVDTSRGVVLARSYGDAAC